MVKALVGTLRADGAEGAAVDTCVRTLSAIARYGRAGLTVARRLPHRENWRAALHDHWLMTRVRAPPAASAGSGPDPAP